jgi:hypothetical protein
MYNVDENIKSVVLYAKPLTMGWIFTVYWYRMKNLEYGKWSGWKTSSILTPYLFGEK